jgi:hypothetical protein
MPRIEPGLVPVVTDLERGLRELEIPFGIIGALVPELLLDARPPRMTNDGRRHRCCREPRRLRHSEGSTWRLWLHAYVTVFDGWFPTSAMTCNS